VIVCTFLIIIKTIISLPSKSTVPQPSTQQGQPVGINTLANLLCYTEAIMMKACASVLGTNLVEVRLGGGICGCTVHTVERAI
jgi:hypothetical protein